MGWSCNKDASETFAAITQAIIERFNSQNTFSVKGRTFFLEVSRREHNDGAITGTVQEIYPLGHQWAGCCHNVGSFRIEGDGRIARLPHFPLEWIEEYRAEGRPLRIFKVNRALRAA